MILSSTIHPMQICSTLILWLFSSNSKIYTLFIYLNIMFWKYSLFCYHTKSQNYLITAWHLIIYCLSIHPCGLLECPLINWSAWKLFGWGMLWSLILLNCLSTGVLLLRHSCGWSLHTPLVVCHLSCRISVCLLITSLWMRFYPLLLYLPISFPKVSFLGIKSFKYCTNWGNLLGLLKIIYCLLSLIYYFYLICLWILLSIF